MYVFMKSANGRHPIGDSVVYLKLKIPLEDFIKKLRLFINQGEKVQKIISKKKISVWKMYSSPKDSDLKYLFSVSPEEIIIATKGWAKEILNSLVKKTKSNNPELEKCLARSNQLLAGSAIVKKEDLPSKPPKHKGIFYLIFMKTKQYILRLTVVKNVFTVEIIYVCFDKKDTQELKKLVSGILMMGKMALYRYGYPEGAKNAKLFIDGNVVKIIFSFKMKSSKKSLQKNTAVK
jgi:hypothetical protein